MEIKIADKYKLVRRIGKGKFSLVYQGIYKPFSGSNSTDVAVKMDVMKSGLIKHEASILNYLYHNKCHNIPLVYWYGLFEEQPTLVMTLYDISLQDYVAKDLIFHPPEKIIHTLLKSLQQIHAFYVLHRDIKPQNIMFKNGDVFLVDFGLSTIYVDDDKKQNPEKQDVHMLGTPKYASIHIHQGISASRRDDVISLLYVFLFMIRKSLPWENLEDIDSDYQESHILHPKNQERFQKKELAVLLQEIRGEKPEILDFIIKAYALEYQDKPNYVFPLIL
jgi:serine/threonine protein kinase